MNAALLQILIFAPLSCYILQLAIYSSGSREAQRLLFANTEAGDLREHLCCFFDTTVGGKREAKSYAQIVLSLGEHLLSDSSEWLYKWSGRYYAVSYVCCELKDDAPDMQVWIIPQRSSS